MACVFALVGCGGRSQPPFGEQESEVAGAWNGGGGRTFALPAKGGTTTGGTTTGAIGGTGTGGTSSARATTVRLPGPAHWFAVAPAQGNLSLVGIDVNYQLDVTELPRLAGMASTGGGFAKFSKTGNRFCYGASKPDTEIGIAELSANTANVRVLSVPPKGALRYFECVGWLTDTLVLLNGYTDPQSLAGSEFVVISTDPSEKVPGLVPVPPDRAYEMSPDRKLWLAGTDTTRTLYRIRDDGFRGEQVLFESQPLGENFWSRNSRRLFTASWNGSGTLPRLAAYDIPAASGPAVSVPLPPNMTEGYPHSCAASSDGRYLSKWREVSGGSSPPITDVGDLETGKSAVIATLISTDVIWLKDTLIAYDRSSSGSLVATRITPSLIAAGRIALTPAYDQDGPITGIAWEVHLSDTALLVERTVASRKAIQVLTATETGFVSEDILPGIVGDSTYGTLIQSYPNLRNTAHQQFETVYPSGFHLDFLQGTLYRFLRERDYFSEADRVSLTVAPEMLGAVANYTASKEYAWLYLEGPSAGRLLTIPLPPADAKDQWFFPESWPKR